MSMGCTQRGTSPPPISDHSFPYCHTKRRPLPLPYPPGYRRVSPSSLLAREQRAALNSVREIHGRKETCTFPRPALRSSRRRPPARAGLRVLDPSPTPSPPPLVVFHLRRLTLWVDPRGASGTTRRSIGHRARPALLAVVPG